MRRRLGVLRQDQAAVLAPQPQLADLPALVNTARRAGVSVELSVPPAGPGAVRRRRVRQPGLRGGIAVQCQSACPGSRGHRVGGPRGLRSTAASGQWTRRSHGPGREGTRAGPRADRDARAGGAARRFAVGRPGTRWRLRGVSGAPTRRDGMAGNRAMGGGVTTRCADRRRPGDGPRGLRRGTHRPARPGRGGQAADGAEAVRQARTCGLTSF